MKIHLLIEFGLDEGESRVLGAFVFRSGAEKARENYLIKTLTPKYLGIIEKTLKWDVKDVLEKQNA